MKRITRIIRPIICMAVLLFAMTTAVMGCYQKETEPTAEQIPHDVAEIDCKRSVKRNTHLKFRLCQIPPDK